MVFQFFYILERQFAKLLWRYRSDVARKRFARHLADILGKHPRMLDFSRTMNQWVAGQDLLDEACAGTRHTQYKDGCLIVNAARVAMIDEALIQGACVPGEHGFLFFERVRDSHSLASIGFAHGCECFVKLLASFVASS